jgi:maleate isomerase
MGDPQERARRLKGAFDDVLAEVLAAVDASRTTLRIDLPELGFQVNDPAGEARASDVRSLLGQTALDQRSLDTVRWLDAHHDYLIQERCDGADPAPPEALIRIYGVQAQMLGPIIRDGRLAGWISVHENRSPRQWTYGEVRRLTEAVAKVHAILDQADA